MAKNVVAAGLARRCEVQLAYAIGVAQPVSVAVDTFGTARAPEPVIMEAIARVFDLTPKGIIRALDLRKPIYSATAAYGHFGRTPERVGSGKSARMLFSWERTDRKAALKRAAVDIMRAKSSHRGNGAGAPRRPKPRYQVAALEDPADGNG